MGEGNKSTTESTNGIQSSDGPNELNGIIRHNLVTPRERERDGEIEREREQENKSRTEREEWTGRVAVAYQITSSMSCLPTEAKQTRPAVPLEFCGFYFQAMKEAAGCQRKSQQENLETFSEKLLTKHPTSKHLTRFNLSSLKSSLHTTDHWGKHKSITMSNCQPLNHERKNTLKVLTREFSWPRVDWGHTCNKQFQAIEVNMWSWKKLSKSHNPTF